MLYDQMVIQLQRCIHKYILKFVCCPCKMRSLTEQIQSTAEKGLRDSTWPLVSNQEVQLRLESI